METVFLLYYWVNKIFPRSASIFCLSSRDDRLHVYDMDGYGLGEQPEYDHMDIFMQFDPVSKFSHKWYPGL